MKSGIKDTERMTVLVVEDELFLRWNLADHLRGAGYLVAEVDSAQRAIALCQSGTRIDILITDIQLSGLGSGWDVAEAFRALSDKIPVIYTSGNARDPRRTVPKSVFDNKPYEPTEVVRVCQQLTA
jgi:two-component system, response regulator PdtaR